ncbi:hypothetical protein M124_0726 [Bacteroides fragilis str. 3988T(B)14]|uniref:Uncharacterized protein n=1 Tax=Bacteroides fragilis str. 3988T(B)14 TaxID=1339315 RepID=A0A015STI3_BACFG|nr:hypothetical protein M124_0726 [Bacteroides fragilis str. 3988T(B)14]EXY81419.1 hypothetical protein M084_0766 [Bacteroides fragilis str. 3988 T1]
MHINKTNKKRFSFFILIINLLQKNEIKPKHTKEIQKKHGIELNVYAE